ncbi:SufE family protein [Psychrobium sp. 1_MG-2023]|uniref:SufE family protein n=1 Tax=Psychrobium sp. 1_MG-2023 TaxID=3062624 RepID=UPI000C32DDEF|nr:SufE family protein [Psychrobium sp. 1_MG-2023]MDP2559680.1 SufE family protein [Psychrobium sp. 1_MG-2023]PKF59511.1 hypothetical protein CW748_01695 [Alteromonadales bacterium alter-6D02]
MYTQSQQALLDQFNALRSWEDRYRTIMRLGKTLPRIDDSLRVDEALLHGCESKVWFHARKHQQGVELTVDSDAKIVKGLISIIVSAYQDLSTAQIAKFDCENFLIELGLLNHLSPSRGNGIKAIIQAIKDTAQE